MIPRINFVGTGTNTPGEVHHKDTIQTTWPRMTGIFRQNMAMTRLHRMPSTPLLVQLLRQRDRFNLRSKRRLQLQLFC